MSARVAVPRSRTHRLCTGLVIALAAFVALAGCGQPKVAPVARKVYAAANLSPTGSYKQGDRVVLENGESITLPTGWEARLLAPGAFANSNANMGGIAQVSSVPHWGSLVFLVCGPKSSYPNGGPVPQGLAGTTKFLSRERQVVPLGGGARATAYVTRWPSVPATAQYVVTLYVERPGVYPLFAEFDLYSLPPGLTKATDVQLPKALLEYFGFKTQ